MHASMKVTLRTREICVMYTQSMDVMNITVHACMCAHIFECMYFKKSAYACM